MFYPSEIVSILVRDQNIFMIFMIAYSVEEGELLCTERFCCLWR